MGPKISSPMTGSCQVTASITVGAMRRASSCQVPPHTTFSGWISPSRRWKCFWLTIFP